MHYWFRVGGMAFLCFAMVIVALSLLARPLHAQSHFLFETAALAATGERTGISVHSEQLLGVRFEVTQTVTTSQVGGHFYRVQNVADGSFFAAIVALEDGADFPDSIDLSTPDVLGTTLLNAPYQSDEVAGNLVLTLEPGWYALVFGSGRFQATGVAAAARNNRITGEHAFFYYRAANSEHGYVDSSLQDVRFFLRAEVVRGADLDCANAQATPAILWPPNQKFRTVQISGVVDAQGSPAAITINTIFQDEPVGKAPHAPDARGIGTATAQVRAERDGKGNGRVYHINFTALDAGGASCTGVVQVRVPKSQGRGGAAVDNGPRYDSTRPSESTANRGDKRGRK